MPATNEQQECATRNEPTKAARAVTEENTGASAQLKDWESSWWAQFSGSRCRKYSSCSTARRAGPRR
jgi:hypothetical protein